MMKKTTVLAVILLLISVGFLSGCSEKDTLVGTWVSTDANIGGTFRLYSDGKCTGSPVSSIGIADTWDIKDGSLVFYMGGRIVSSYAYAIATRGDEKMLHLTSGNFICSYDKQ